MPTESIRVHALAKELGIKSREILDAVAEKLEDLELKGHQSSIPPERILEVKAMFAPPASSSPASPDGGSLAPKENDEGPSNAQTAPASTEDGESDEDVPRKKRRRRRRGGRRRRGRGGDSEESTTESTNGESTSDQEPVTEDESKTVPDESIAATGVSSDRSEGGEATVAAEDPESVEPEAESGEAEDPPTDETSVVETPKPAAKPKRRSLYGGRFQRVGSTPAPTREDL